MISLVCRVCLVGDVRMHCIGGDLGLQEIYEKVTSTKLYTEDNRPVTICYICCSQLQKCNRFAEMSWRAEKLLTELIDNGYEIMQKNLSLIPNLAVTATTLISLESDIESAPGDVKEEFSDAEENDIDGFETSEMLDIETFETKEGSTIDCNNFYICDVCNEAFTSESRMVTHFQTHTQEKSLCNTPLSTTSSPKIHEDVNTQSSFICDHCNKAFTKRNSIRDHMKTHRIKSYACKQCNSSFTSYSDLLKHRKIHKKARKQINIICNICGKILSQRSAWTRHMKVHTGEKPYACNQCHMTFNQSCSLKRHKTIHTKPQDLNQSRSFKCRECNKQYLRFGPMQKHLLKCTGVECTPREAKAKEYPMIQKKQYICDICSKTLSNKTSLKFHLIRKHLKIKPHTCNQCAKDFVTKDELIVHSRIHTKEKPFICDYCSKSFYTRNCVLCHIIKSHSGKPPYKPRIALKQQHICHICGKEFKSTNGMNEHIRRHTGERPYTCEYCNKTFISRSAKSVHKKFYTGIKPYACNSCDKAFFQKSSLRVHLTTHAGILARKYACDKCNKSYSTRRELIIHMRSHTGERPFSCGECNKMVSTLASLKRHLSLHSEKKYTCSVCNKKFALPGSLKVHMFTHTDQKPYSCIQCAKMFVNTSNLKAHNKVHHPELEQKCK